MNITELAIYRKMFGGGGSPAPVEGTAIPTGYTISHIYFNKNNTIIQNAQYLSQLTYIQTDFFEHPICGIYGMLVNDKPVIIFASKEVVNDYETADIFRVQILLGENLYDLFVGSRLENWNLQNHIVNNGFITSDMDLMVVFSDGVELAKGVEGRVPLTDFNGLPLGVENEKIKNVLSITPFGASATSGASAHHLRSVDELPSNAKDGSIAIVDTPHGLYGTWQFSGVINNMPYNSWKVAFECDGVTYTTLAAYGSINYYTPLSEEVVAYQSEGRWKDVKYQTIKIIDGGNQELQGWLSKDAQRIDAAIAHEVYYRENGEWKYVGTTSEAISAEYY